MRVLALLLLQAVFEEVEDGPVGAIDLFVLAHADHGVGIHGLAGEELEILEGRSDVLNVCLGLE